MFNDVNKSKLEFDKYLKLKEKTLAKSYAEKFKGLNTFLYIFSWVGNVISIFLAYWFVQKLLFSSLKVCNLIL